MKLGIKSKERTWRYRSGRATGLQRHKFLVSLGYITGLEDILASLEVHNDRKHSSVMLGIKTNERELSEVWLVRNKLLHGESVKSNCY